MQDHPKGAGDGPAITTWDEDDREQAAILRQVLELHPATLTMDELVREMTGGGTREFPSSTRSSARYGSWPEPACSTAPVRTRWFDRPGPPFATPS